MDCFCEASSLLFALLVHLVSCQMCDRRWFGPRCQFQCHCQNLTCDFVGECHGTTCESGYFGPSCQYVDLALNFERNNTKSYLTDQDVNTCNPNESATSVMVELKKESSFSWMRIEINNPQKMQNFKLKLGGSAAICRHLRFFVFSKTVMDVTCDITTPVSNVTVDGIIAGAICSVYISGGHNVALRETTFQSSTYNDMNSNYAVDGIASKNFSTCSRTLDGSQQEWWSVSFSDPQFVKTVIIINDESIGTRNYTVQLFHDNGHLINSYNVNDSGAGKKEAEVNCQELSISLRIFERLNYSVAFCEVLVFAETLCPDGLYGLNCDEVCTCAYHKMCNSVTGKCGDGCYGTHRYTCKHPCNRNCSASNCMPGSSNCPTCSPGYRGELCNFVCPTHTYGDNCSRNCSQLCEDALCSYETGYCLSCPPGQHLPLCEECPPKTYGIDCLRNCSKKCFKQLCDPVSGDCLQCDIGYYGPKCQKCESSTYGDNCNNTCLYACFNDCDIITGDCYSCLNGHTGPKCNECPKRSFGPSCIQHCPKSCRNNDCEPVMGNCYSCVTGTHGSKCEEDMTDFANIYKTILILAGFSSIIPICLLFQAFILIKKRYSESSTISDVTYATTRV